MLHVYFDDSTVLFLRSEFSFDFKSTGRDGILFYAYGDRHVDFIAVYLSEGQINYAFNCGSGTARMISPNTYNDGQWHSVSSITLLKFYYLYVFEWFESTSDLIFKNIDTFVGKSLRNEGFVLVGSFLETTDARTTGD